MEVLTVYFYCFFVDRKFIQVSVVPVCASPRRWEIKTSMARQLCVDHTMGCQTGRSSIMFNARVIAAVVSSQVSYDILSLHREKIY